MPKFVLIDHSIRDLAGHHYEYAVHVLRAAEQAGYEPVLVTNRAFRQSETVPWRVLPQYEFGFWPEPKVRRFQRLTRAVACRTRRIWFRIRCHVLYSTLGLAWSSRYQWKEHLARKPQAVSGWPEYLLSVALVGAFKIMRTLVLFACLPFEIAALVAWGGYRLARILLAVLAGTPARLGRLLARACAQQAPPALLRRGLRAVTLEAKTYYEFAAAAWDMIGGAFARRRRREAALRRQRRRQAKAFARDTRRLLAKIGCHADDVFFLPTISPDDMLGLAEALGQTDHSSQASWHLLFRRNIYEGRRPGYGSQENQLEELRRIFQAFRDGCRGVAVRFYTDSDELSEQYGRLGVFEFHTLPIPHTYSPDQRVPHAGPLRITYLGDARREKGFHLLPQIIGDLRADYLETGRARFVVQCNYNIPEGEPEAVVARSQLESLPPAYITLYKNSLTSEEYRDLLLSADINLLLYEQANYYARSSGVLVESLAAGIPVIVPAGTWLARQFLSVYYRHQEAIAERTRVLSTLRHHELSWRRYGGSEEKLEEKGEFDVGFEDKLCCFVDRPAGATHMLVRIEFADPAGEAYLYMTPLDWTEAAVTECKVALLEAGERQRRAAHLLRLPPGTSSVWLAVGSSHKESRTPLRGLQCDFLEAASQPPFPTGAVGLIYQHLSEVPELLREMIEHYPHYRQTATEFANHVRSFHNPERLVAELLQQSGLRPVSRVAATVT